MMKQVFLATAFAVALSSWAVAQDTPPPVNTAPPAAGADMTPPPPPGKGPGHKEDRDRKDRRDEKDDRDEKGPPPPPKKGVEIRMGRDTGIKIECGDEPIKACLEAAKPLTDKIPMLTMPPAPPAPPAPPVAN